MEIDLGNPDKRERKCARHLFADGAGAVASLLADLGIALLDLGSVAGTEVGGVDDAAEEDLGAGDGALLGPGEGLVGVVGLDDPPTGDVVLRGDVEGTLDGVGVAAGVELDVVGIGGGRGEGVAAEEDAGGVHLLVVLGHGLEGLGGVVGRAALGRGIGAHEEDVLRHFEGWGLLF